MELGIYTFAEVMPGRRADEPGGPAQRLRDLIEEIALADQVGLDVFGVGEHHRPDFAVSAPAVVLAAAAERTERIRLTSAVTVLSSDDPVRVFQDFATLDLLSGGRAEIMAGRGSFIESFPLFGYDLERLRRAVRREARLLLLRVREHERVTWTGTHRAPIDDRGVYPRPLQRSRCRSGSPSAATRESAIRAGTLGLPMAIAIIGGDARALRAVRRSCIAKRRLGPGHDPPPALSINSHGYIAPTSQEALDGSFPAVSEVMNRIGRERGWSPMTPGRLRRRGDAARRELRRQPAAGRREDPVPARDLPATIASSCSSAWARCPTMRSCGRSSCSGPRSRPPCTASSRLQDRADVPGELHR